MLNSWFGSKSSRHRSPPAHNNTQPGPSYTSLVSQSTAEPVQIAGNLTSTSDILLEEVHAHINDPSAYAPAPSLIHSAEKDAGTLRTSEAPASSLGATTYLPEHDTLVAERIPEGTLFTPQDAILAQVFGKSAPTTPEPVHGIPPPSSSAAQPSVASGSAHTPASVPASRTQSGPTLTIYEPFSGARLSEHQTPVSPSTVTPREYTPAAPLLAADDRKLWASLERILELQAEIAGMHADMEGVGGRGLGANPHIAQAVIANIGVGEGGAEPRKGSKRGQTLPIGDEEPEEPGPEGDVPGVAASEVSTEHSGGEDDDDDEVHGYAKKRRDEEFSKLAEQFSQRKAAIGGIMNKLDALSTALKTFHTIPPPLFDLAVSPNRSDIVSSAPPNVSPPSPPPPHVHSGRPSSFSSISPSQAVHAVTPPFSPPVPPISTLAPPRSPGDPGAPVVAPILPRMALPTIISGAPHVESPADMDHVQSIFQKFPNSTRRTYCQRCVDVLDRY